MKKNLHRFFDWALVPPTLTKVPPLLAQEVLGSERIK